MLHKDTKSMIMTELEAIDYAKARVSWLKEATALSCDEIGDGNLNYVFRIWDRVTQKAVIIKQSGPVARISDAFKVSPDRNRIEFELLSVYNALVPEYVPEVYGYDSERHCMLMEDLSTYTILRQGLLEGQMYKSAPSALASFMAKSHVLTSDYAKGAKVKRTQMSRFINPELCEITEDLVLTEPFYDCSRNEVSEATRKVARDLLWQDPAVAMAAAELKHSFMTKSEVLIHGDLHTGSVFVNSAGVKVIDHEFATYGPAGFDLGSLLANFIFARIHHEMRSKDSPASVQMVQWLKLAMAELVKVYCQVWQATWQEPLDSVPLEAIRVQWLAEILSETAGFAGCELCRRIIGIAHVKDMTSLEGNLRDKAEALSIKIGKALMVNRKALTTAQALIHCINDEFE